MNSAVVESPEMRKAARQIIMAVLDSIREAGSTGLISGHLYATLNSQGMSLDTYNRLIQQFKSIGVVTERNHVLYWMEAQ